MSRDLRHSAEGSHWTKQNHKYIRKEGNRYIYPEDVKKSQRNVNPRSKPKIISRNPTSILGKGTVRLTTGDGYYKDVKVDNNPNEHRKAYKEVWYSTAYSNNKQHKKPGEESFNGYGTHLSGEYSKSIKERNRQQAMVNEKKAQAEKDRYSQANRGGMKQKKREDMIFNAGGQYKDDRKRLSEGFEKGINYKVDKGEAKRLYRSSNDPKRIADKKTYGCDVPDRFIGPTDKAREIKTKKAQEFERKFAANGHGAKNQEYAKAQNARQAVNRQGSLNRQQKAKDFKEYQDWERADAKKRDKSVVSKEPYVSDDYKQELEYNSKKNDGSSSKNVTTWDNSKNVTTWDNTPKSKPKSTNGQKGHFTLDKKSGETTFVPDEDKSKDTKTKSGIKEKGKKAISKIKNALRKK